MTLSIVEADLSRIEDAQAVRFLLQSYAADPLGGGIALSDDVLDRVIPGLQMLPGVLVLLAWVDARPAGLAIGFRTFSTWKAAPAINLHDLAVHPDFRGRGIGRALLSAVETHARQTGCCRVTLEVRVDNDPAKKLYLSEGFRPGDHPQEFWLKHL
jgi:ribosomal protein S18 acetylase RimI-like enzyme